MSESTIIYFRLIAARFHQDIERLPSPFEYLPAEKFAFLYPPGSPIPPTNGQNMPDEKFPTGFFSSESELSKWLSG